MDRVNAMTKMTSSLRVAYDELDGISARAVPDWAYALAAPIPFIGERYGADGEAPRVLVYASAENLRTHGGG